jgi:hypothetical protein
MGDWCGSTTVDLTDQIEATGAGKGKQRKRRLNNIISAKRKKSVFSQGKVFFYLTRTLMGDPRRHKISPIRRDERFDCSYERKRRGYDLNHVPQ